MSSVMSCHVAVTGHWLIWCTCRCLPVHHENNTTVYTLEYTIDAANVLFSLFLTFATSMDYTTSLDNRADFFKITYSMDNIQHMPQSCYPLGVLTNI